MEVHTTLRVVHHRRPWYVRPRCETDRGSGCSVRVRWGRGVLRTEPPLRLRNRTGVLTQVTGESSFHVPHRESWQEPVPTESLSPPDTQGDFVGPKWGGRGTYIEWGVSLLDTSGLLGRSLPPRVLPFGRGLGLPENSYTTQRRDPVLNG